MPMGEKHRTEESLKKAAFQFIDRNRGEIAKIGDAIFYFAELGMQEFRTSEYTADALRKAGFTVESGIAGIPPAWMATWGAGKPVIGVHCEGDALPNCSQVPGVAEEREKNSHVVVRETPPRSAGVDRGAWQWPLRGHAP